MSLWSRLHICLLAAALCASAQEFRAGITGLVHDPQGSAMAQVTIEAVNSATNEITRAVTNDTGYYSMPALAIGMYQVTASAAGFKKATRSKVELRVGEQVKLDFTLEIGAVSESVTITDEPELLQTLATDKGQVISEQNVEDLPSVGRNPFLLGAMATGVQFDVGAGPLSRAVRPFDAGNNVAESMSINGGRLGASDLLLDGMTNTGTETTTATNMGFVPSPDAVQQFRIQTSNYDAQYGRTAGGTVSVSLKAGTNKLHGVVYEYLRNDVISANTFDQNRLGNPRTSFKWNQPGFELDGPLFIPHVYNGHNRTFFMYSYEIIRDKIPSPVTDTVPQPEALQGNFNTTLQSNGQPITVYDPTTTVQTSASTYSRQPFPSNVIPANRMNPVGVKIASFIPKPNLPGQTQNLVVAPNARTDAYDAHAFRIDQVLNEKHRFFSRFVRGNRTEENSTNGYPREVSPQFNDGRITQSGNFDLTSMLSPTVVLTSRAGFFRHDLWINLYTSGFDPTSIGFPASLMKVLPPYFPAISMTSYTTFGSGRNGGNQLSYSNSWSWSEFVNKTRGRHGLKFGGEFRSILNNINSPTTNFGSFAFTPTFTQANPLTASSANGNSIASLLLGFPNSGSAPINPAFAYGYHYYGTFLQDDWRATNRLTFSLGLRWDYESPVTERNNQQNAGFDPNATSPLQVPGYNLKGGLLFTSSDNRRPYQRDLNNVQPRAGVAWQANRKTVVRAGYGLSYLATFTTAQSQGYSTTTPYVATNGSVFLSGNSLSNPYPDGILTPNGSKLGLATFLGQSISFTNPDRIVPKVHQFSVGIQRELKWRTVVEASYVGSRSHSLDVSQQIDDVTKAQFLQYGAALTGTQTNPFAGLIPGTGLNTASTSLQQLLRPFPQFTGITETNLPVGQSWYNSLQVRVDKRLSRGLNVLVSYTLSKWLDAVSYLNNQDPFGSTPPRVLNAQDATHRFVVSGNWALPFFKNSHGVLAVFLKGWQGNGIFVRQSGFPLGAPSGFYSSGIDPSLPDPTNARWFNTCTQQTNGNRVNCPTTTELPAFIQQPAQTLRTLSLRFPTIRFYKVPNLDVSLFKAFQLHERLKLQFRAEAFNGLNAAQLGSPSTSLTSNGAGQVGLTQSNDPRNIQLAMKLVF
jgi:Carboxypeptidase regulatory-like domain/TonB dependent receptor-like, beta-barrel